MKKVSQTTQFARDVKKMRKRGFASSDKQQLQAAKLAGMKTKLI